MSIRFPLIERLQLIFTRIVAKRSKFGLRRGNKVETNVRKSSVFVDFHCKSSKNKRE